MAFTLRTVRFTKVIVSASIFSVIFTEASVDLTLAFAALSKSFVAATIPPLAATAVFVVFTDATVDKSRSS